MIIDSGVVTGSLQVSGSLTVKGNLTVDGTINGTITGSVTSASYATFAENAGLLNNLVSSSFVGTASFSTFSGSIVTRVGNLESTASTLTTASSSFATVSASYSKASGSLSTRVTTIETSYATTGSNTFTGNNVFGNITGSNAKFNTASIEYLNVIYQTSSIVYSSGSNQFGDAAGDVQTLFGTVDVKTGPVLVTGSLRVSGGITGSLNGSNLIAGSVANDRLTNSSVTVTAGTGMSGGGAVALGSSVTLTNAGVTSNVAGTGVTVSGGTGAVTISIGQAVGTASNVQFNSLGVGTAGSAVAGEIRATADVTAFYSSDERLKENITPIENPIEKLMAINGVTFDWKEGFETLHSHVGSDTGVVAQQIEAIQLPGVVTTRETGYMAVNYEKLNALLIEGFKAQQNEINELKELVKTLLNK
jgi:hypothetical protein